jgi:hypothetical protein
MKTNETKRRGPGVWNSWRSLFGRGPLADQTTPVAETDEPTTPPASALVRIQEYLQAHGLSKLVRARYEAVNGDIVLEDDDGQVYAKDYGTAVEMIERMWLPQP